VGDIVLIEGEVRGTAFWSIVKVMEVFPARDGCVSLVRLQTRLGEVTRPVQRVYHLEVRTPVVVTAEKEPQTMEVKKPNSPVLRKTVTT
jgi:hypothetical protein